ncbi:hypothetical protein BP00DRAFT_2359 [Aspergillus indologenus CBS 114.80]|uniref:Secreted protein n=1 Tax=Aspergillus indologenus CBS 114.80 TaxID=1450541 RepID=A0A2V5IKS7_9EURO|nr:hypothetical protein BP00DRAFT_2359 [Aspergillus indologenus CBS 114.80]
MFTLLATCLCRVTSLEALKVATAPEPVLCLVLAFGPSTIRRLTSHRFTYCMSVKACSHFSKFGSNPILSLDFGVYHSWVVHPKPKKACCPGS